MLRTVQKNLPFILSQSKFLCRNSNSREASTSILSSVNQCSKFFHTSNASSKEIKLTVEDGAGEKFDVSMWPGDKLHDAMLDAGVDLECACDGEAMCSTCHCIFISPEVFDALPIAEEEEEDMLDLAMELTDTSRLSCQVEYQKELDGCEIRLPSETSNYY